MLLGRGELLGHDTNMVTSGEILGGLGPPRRGSLPADVVKVVFAPDSEIRVFEFERLQVPSVILWENVKNPFLHLRLRHSQNHHYRLSASLCGNRTC